VEALPEDNVSRNFLEEFFVATVTEKLRISQHQFFKPGTVYALDFV
jgi:hypothetical protein